MHDTDPDSYVRPDPRRRWKWLGVLSAAALLLHVAALGGAGWAWPARERPPLPGTAVQVRVVDAEPALAAVAAEVPTAAPVEALAVATPPRVKAAGVRVAARTAAAPSPAVAPATADPAPEPANRRTTRWTSRSPKTTRRRSAPLVKSARRSSAGVEKPDQQPPFFNAIRKNGIRP